MAGAATFITAGFLALADVVFLTNGNEIQGEVVKEENGRVFLKFPGGILELPRKQIKSIERQPRIDYLVDEGEKMVRRGDFEDAIKILEEAAALDAASVRARDALLGAQERWAIHLREIGRFDESRAAFLRILEKAPQHPRARDEARAIDVTLEEARKEEERGRDEIATGDLEKGLWRLQRVHDRFADRRKALAPVLAAGLIREGDARLSARSWKEAEERYERALEIDPDSLPGLRRQHTIAMVRQIEGILPGGDFAGVEALASEGLEVDPARPVLRYYRGIALEGRGKGREAADDYLAITRGPRPQDFKPSSLARLRAQAEAKLVEEEKPEASRRQDKEDQFAADFLDLRTPHFVIRSKRERTAKEVELIAENAYEAIFRDLGCLTHLRSPIEITIHPTREEYAVSSGMASWSGGAHSVSARRGSLSEHKISCFEEQPRLLTGVVPHEVAHALFAHRLNYPKAIPLWATEGFAILREPAHFHRHYRRVLLQERARRTLLPVKDVVELATYPDERVGVFYAQSFSIVEFLLSIEDIDTFLSLVKALSDEGADFDETLRKYYGLRGRVALENRWLGWFEEENK